MDWGFLESDADNKLLRDEIVYQVVANSSFSPSQYVSVGLCIRT